MKRTTIHAAVALMLLAPAAALAQHFEAVDNIPWPRLGRFPAYPVEAVKDTEVWVHAGLLRDTNIFRLSTDVNRRNAIGNSDPSEVVLRVGAGIRHTATVVGRQRLALEARGDQYSFHKFTALNHVGYGLRAAWLWEATNDLSGTLGVERRQRLVDLAALQRPVKDLIIEDRAFVDGAYRLGPSVRLRGGLDTVRLRHSDDSLAAANSRSNTGRAGVDYVTTLGNAFGVEVRETRANYPTAEPIGSNTLVDNEFTERELAFVTTVVAGPTLTGVGRIGRTTRKHEQFPQRDFKGTTWRATLDWTPLRKTGFEVSFYREPRSIIDLAASYVLVTGTTFGPRWAPTEKVVVYAFALRERQQYQGDPSVAVLGTTMRDEQIRGYRFGAGWEPRRYVELSAGLDHGTRTSNVFLRDYRYTAIMANAAFRYY
jgi:hypothetical protein